MINTDTSGIFCGIGLLIVFGILIKYNLYFLPGFPFRRKNNT